MDRVPFVCHYGPVNHHKSNLPYSAMAVTSTPERPHIAPDPAVPDVFFAAHNTAHEGILRPQLDHGLTDRRGDIIAYAAKGLAYKEIAFELGITINSIHRLLQRGFQSADATVNQDAIEVIYGLGQRTLDPYHADRYKLSCAQARVFEAMLEGNNNPQVARQLDISENTVKQHVQKILISMDALNRSHTIGIAHGLFDLGRPKRAAPSHPAFNSVLKPAGDQFGLTTPENEVIALIAQGIGSEGARHILGLPRRKIRDHRLKALKKLDASTHLHAVAKLYQLALDPELAEKYALDEQALQVLELATKGLANTTIGQQLGISANVAYRSIEETQTRLGARSLAHMISLLCGLVAQPATSLQMDGAAAQERHWETVDYPIPSPAKALSAISGAAQATKPKEAAYGLSTPLYNRRELPNPDHPAFKGLTRQQLSFGLSLRQRQVMAFTAKGYNTAQIGRLLYVSPKVIKAERAAVTARLNTCNSLHSLMRLYGIEAPDPSRLRALEITGDEMEVLTLEAQGYTLAETATRLSLSKHGVNHRKRSLFEKLGARNQILAASIVYGIVNPTKPELLRKLYSRPDTQPPSHGQLRRFVPPLS